MKICGNGSCTDPEIFVKGGPAELRNRFFFVLFLS